MKFRGYHGVFTDRPVGLRGNALAASMTISGVALLALCALLGQVVGELLGSLLGVKANVGGVGFAMLLLIGMRLWLKQHGLLSEGINRGVSLWGSLYIPIVVAMAAQQDVVAAVRGGPMVILGAILVVMLCFAMVTLISRLAGSGETMDEIEAREEADLAARITRGDQ